MTLLDIAAQRTAEELARRERESLWQVTVWCTDCGNGQDPMGCFDGGSETYEERFTTREEAQRFADLQRIEMGSPWQYDVEPVPSPSEVKDV